MSSASLVVSSGRMVGVAGANGAGKSTLINACAGWSRGRPSIEGDVVLYGESVRRLAAHQRSNAGLMHVPEGKNVFGNLTVAENLLLVRKPPPEPGRHYFTQDEIFSLFPRLHRRQHIGSALSGGERQMLVISRALLKVRPHPSARRALGRIGTPPGSRNAAARFQARSSMRACLSCWSSRM